MLIRREFGQRVRVDIDTTEYSAFLTRYPRIVRVEGFVELRNDGGVGIRTDACELVTFDGKGDPALTSVYHYPADISVPERRISDASSSARGYTVDARGVTFECV